MDNGFHISHETRDDLGKSVRDAWIVWALTQPSPKPSWLVPYSELAEHDKEADRQIGEAILRKVLTRINEVAGDTVGAIVEEIYE